MNLSSEPLNIVGPIRTHANHTHSEDLLPPLDIWEASRNYEKAVFSSGSLHSLEPVSLILKPLQSGNVNDDDDVLVQVFVRRARTIIIFQYQDVVGPHLLAQPADGTPVPETYVAVGMNHVLTQMFPSPLIG